MINPNTKENINIKIEQAHEVAQKALELCDEFSINQSPKHLKVIGGYLGTFVNNLRSALNYASVDYCEQRGILKNKNGKDLPTDFPYGMVEEKFKSIDLVKFMMGKDPELYNFVESIQPYHSDKKLIGHVMKISNMDKHKVLANVENFDINSFVVLDKDFFQPRHLGGAVLMGIKDGKPVLVDTPTYVPALRMYALRDGKWLNYMIPMDGYHLEFIPFIKNTGREIVNILNDFYRLWK